MPDSDPATQVALAAARVIEEFLRAKDSLQGGAEVCQLGRRLAFVSYLVVFANQLCWDVFLFRELPRSPALILRACAGRPGFMATVARDHHTAPAVAYRAISPSCHVRFAVPVNKCRVCAVAGKKLVIMTEHVLAVDSCDGWLALCRHGSKPSCCRCCWALPPTRMHTSPPQRSGPLAPLCSSQTLLRHVSHYFHG